MRSFLFTSLHSWSPGKALRKLGAESPPPCVSVYYKIIFCDKIEKQPRLPFMHSFLFKAVHLYLCLRPFCLWLTCSISIRAYALIPDIKQALPQLMSMNFLPIQVQLFPSMPPLSGLYKVLHKRSAIHLWIASQFVIEETLIALSTTFLLTAMLKTFTELTGSSSSKLLRHYYIRCIYMHG